MKLQYPDKQKEIIEKLVKEFSKVHNNEKRIDLLWWYDIASGIENIEVTEQIMKDIKAI
ncbi:hypothetical protein [Peribacillus frigoritolerans]|uniref:hypothetical protein n=1 Tax=Peribacillus frigoritolerans TaxID=450367 RepID=UPI002079CA93|nr:hypothetical protein [Peribacillus frigoritolerans]USK77691.1 hypothetical protein LIT31_26410 [Peribacillus frigoritolerans]USK77897.1 hypothetical protein LIT31_26800 [Peribacillus frigoritolerans]